MISQLGFAFPMALERSNKCLEAFSEKFINGSYLH